MLGIYADSFMTASRMSRPNDARVIRKTQAEEDARWRNSLKYTSTVFGMVRR